MNARTGGLRLRLVNRARAFCLSDGVPLMILGLGIAARGVSYTPHGPERTVAHPAEAAFPMSAWGVIWVTVGVACMVASLWAESRAAAVALGVGVGLNLLWAGSFIAASIMGDLPRGWVTAVGYVSVSALVIWSTWRGGQLRPIKEEANGGDTV